MTDRPRGITILSILFLVGGGLMLVTPLLLLFGPPQMDEGLEAIGASRAMLAAGLLLLAVLGLAGGVGMWRGRPWGWWCAGFYFAYAVARAANALFMAAGMAEQLAIEATDGGRGPSYFYAKFGIRIVVNCLLLAYLFKGNVLAYFTLEGLGKAKAIGLLLTAVGLTYTVFYLAQVSGL